MFCKHLNLYIFGLYISYWFIIYIYIYIYIITDSQFRDKMFTSINLALNLHVCKPWYKRMLVWYLLACLHGFKPKYFQHCYVTSVAEVWLFLRLASSWRTCRTTGTTVWVCSPSNGCSTSCSPGRTWNYRRFLRCSWPTNTSRCSRLMPSRSGRSVTTAVYSPCFKTTESWTYRSKI